MAAPRRDWAPLLVGAAAALYFASLVRYGLHLGEDGDVVYLIYRTFTGQRPYIDFASGYTPGFFYFNAALLHLFGDNLLALRWSLVVVNTLAVMGLYRIARRLLPPAAAVVPALGYVALMPVFRGEFATFNVPYPAWYVVLTWAASTLALLRFFDDARPGWLALAGLLAGVGCAFKPNSGAFNLAALVFTLLWACPGTGSRVQRATWWILLLSAVTGILTVFGFRMADRDARLLLWPVLALALVRAVSWRRGVVPRLSAGLPLGGTGALLGGFALITVPWTAYYAVQLGLEGFLHEVLFIGTGHALFFYLAIRDLGIWDVAMLAAAGAALLGGAAIRGGWVRRSRLLLPVVILVAVASLVVVLRAPMPEGFVRAVAQRLQYLAFGAAIEIHWLAVAVAVWKVARSPSADAAAAWVTLLIGAPVMFLSIYPRSDFFHWMLSAPFTLLLAMSLYWRLAEWWSGPAPWSWAALVPAYAVVAVVLVPPLLLGARVTLWPAGKLASLGIDRAPVVLESGRARRMAALHDVTQYVVNHTAPSDTLLGFPNLHLINFLTGRQVPGRYGSFHPGWPDHVVEAEIIDNVEVRRPPLLVVNHDQQLFMGHAPLYYFMLRQYVRQQYGPAAEIGSYDVLRRRDVPSPPADFAALPAAGGEAAETCDAALQLADRDVPESAAGLAPCWRSTDARAQERAVTLARESRDPGGMQPLAQALAAGSIAPRAALLAVRAMAEIADARSLPALIAARTVVEGAVRDELTTALFTLATRALIERYFFYPRLIGEEAVRGDAATGAVLPAWLDDADPRLRVTAAWIAGVRGDAAAIPGVRRLFAEPDLGLRLVAGDALLRLGVADDVGEPLLDTLARDEMFMPSLVLDWSVANRARAVPLLIDTYRHGNDKQRETIAFLASALGEPALAPVVREGLTAPEPRVRTAALWALGVLGARDARTQIAALREHDPIEQVRVFAARSLRWLDAQRARDSAPLAGTADVR